MRSSRRIAGGRDQLTRNGLVVVQSAAALVLLVGSGLLLQSFLALRNVDPGYDTADIFTFQMAPDFDELGVSDGPSAAQLHYAFLDRLAGMPGVESVGLVNTLPLDEGAPDDRFVTEQTNLSSGVEPQMMRYTFAGGDYFQTMGIDLLHGNHFERYANPTGEVKVIVSRSAADLFWPGEDPIGKLLRPAEEDDIGWFTVAGVVEDVLLFDLRAENPEPMVYLPMVGHTAESWGVGTPAYVVKTARAGTIAPEIRELIHQITPSAPMYRVFTMDGLAARSMAQLSFTMMTLFIAASMALILGAVGIYGTLSYVVAQRTREIGIRMALGAQAREVRRMVVSQGGGVALVGVVVGLVGALGLTRFLDSLLFGVGAVDAKTFVMMSGLMLAVALVASYMPARRASAVDPIESLRAE